MAQPRDWELRIDGFIKTLEARIVRPLGEPAVSVATTAEHLTVERASRLSFRPIRPGQEWGREWEYAWFRCRVRLPEVAPGEGVVLTGHAGDDNNESIVFVNGAPAGGMDRWHRHIDLSRLARPGRAVDIMLESYAGHRRPDVYFQFLHPGGRLMPPARRRYQTYRGLTLGEWNEAAFQLWIDAVVLRRLCNCVQPDSLRQKKLEQVLRELTCLLDLEASQEEFQAGIPAARRLLAPLLAARNGSTMPVMHVFGNSHIDVAWLWPLAQTYRKNAHTHASMLALMDRYKEFRFLQSQAQLYQYLKTQYPQVYAGVKAAARRGQWIPEGSMWVEADMNVSGGEALIRQFLFGKRFFRQEFGLEQTVCWLPDVFGYNANLPQILRGCGVKYFTTQKIFWNYHGGTAHPYETFVWEGIDGSTVLTHLHRDYNADTHPEAVARRWRDCVHKDGTEKFLFPFGWGDGGGGPTRQQLEFLRREADLEGLPRCRWSSPVEFFAELEKTPPKDRWVGELYLEVHRGTYTNQARVKRGNRKCELALREAELWSALAGALAGRKYPAARLEENWKKVLLNQFHDILPGSSIGRVYAEAEALHREVLKDAAELAADARSALARAKGGWSVWNSLSWPRDALVEVPDEGCPVDEQGNVLAAQAVGTGSRRRLLVLVPDVPACGAQWVSFRPGSRKASPAESPMQSVSARAVPGGAVLENDQLRLRINARGELAECLDKQAHRQLIPAGSAGNRLEMYRDNPANWDAWDIDVSYKCAPVKLGAARSVRVVAAGPLEARVAVRRTIGRSQLEQQIVLQAGSRRVDFCTVVDWRETHRLLKAAFPAELSAGVLRGEIQFGHVIRPTHRNMEFERQRFEWPAQKWADLSEAGYGIAVMNDCKYGYDILDGVLRLTLLRASIAPDPDSDRGRQEFTYALYVHNSSFAESDTVRQAYELNVPATVQPGRSGSAGPMLEISNRAVIGETVKGGEDGRGVVVRVYESLGGSAETTLRLAGAYQTAWECDMLESPSRKLALTRGGAVRLRLRPFQTKTVKFQ